MIVRSFKSVIWVGAVAGAALSCYMVSLRVASERASLERVESRILMAKRDIRSLDTELVTRGRIRQLERWNVEVLALAAPVEAQFLEGEVQLAGLARVDPLVAPMATDAAPQDAAMPDEGRVVLASYRPERAARPSPIVRAKPVDAAPVTVAKADPANAKAARPNRTASADTKPAAKVKFAARELAPRAVGEATPGSAR